MNDCMCVCVLARMRVRALVHAGVRACICMHDLPSRLSNMM